METAREFIASHPATADGQDNSVWIEQLAAKTLLDAGRLDEAQTIINRLRNDPRTRASALRALERQLKARRRDQQGSMRL